MLAPEGARLVKATTRYALTGGTGFVGGGLARLLRSRGHEVVALVRQPGAAPARMLERDGVTLVAGDLLDRDALGRLCAGVDGLFHVAGWYRLGGGRPQDAWQANVAGTAAVVAAARTARVPKVVYTSTLAVNSDTRGRVVDETYRFTGRHLTAYDETKARAHDIARQAAADGLPVVVVQPGMVYGPGDTSQTGLLMRSVLAGGRPVVPSAGELCWAHVDDVALGHLLAMERGTPGESYMLAGERASLAGGLRMLAALAGQPGPRVMPTAAVRAFAAVAAGLERVVPLPPGYSAEAMRAGLATYLGSAGKAYAHLGWRPRPLADGLRDLVGAAG